MHRLCFNARCDRACSGMLKLGRMKLVSNSWIWLIMSVLDFALENESGWGWNSYKVTFCCTGTALYTIIVWKSFLQLFFFACHAFFKYLTFKQRKCVFKVNRHAMHVSMRRISFLLNPGRFCLSLRGKLTWARCRGHVFFPFLSLPFSPPLSLLLSHVVQELLLVLPS